MATRTSTRTALRAVATLTVVAPPALAGRKVAIDPRGTVVGRDPSCQWALDSELVSRRHFRIKAHGNAYEIEDLGSMNGTLVNDAPLTGARELHHGDRLTAADVELEFRQEGENPEARALPLRRELRQAPGFSVSALLLAVASSAVTTVLTGAAGTGQWGTLAGAALGPLATTVFSTKRAGEKGRIRVAAIVILTLGALVITWTGFSLTEAAAGKSVIPGTDGRSRTFPGTDKVAVTSTTEPPAPPAPTPTTPAAFVDPAVAQCGAVAVGSDAPCPGVTIHYTGAKRLHIVGVEVTGPDAEDFTPGQECVGKWLDPGETCGMSVRFQPSDAADRHATLVIHQNLPRPDRGTEEGLTGTGTPGSQPPSDSCLSGYVWRETVPDDHVCVAPAIRDQAQQDNQLADTRRDPLGGPYGPDTCLAGFVWREAVANDHVCVTPETRSQAQDDNSQTASRRQ
jgi:hypothetical protein